MIIIKTKLRKIPDKCKNCKFCNVEHIRFRDSVRVCSITGNDVPYVYNKSKRNWEYTKAPNCPLIEVGVDNE